MAPSRWLAPTLLGLLLAGLCAFAVASPEIHPTVLGFGSILLVMLVLARLDRWLSRPDPETGAEDDPGAGLEPDAREP